MSFEGAIQLNLFYDSKYMNLIYQTFKRHTNLLGLKPSRVPSLQ